MTPKAFGSRGQTEVLGAILMFALVLATVGMLQIHAVPPANTEIEYDHSLRVQTDMRGVSEAALGAAANGVEEVASVEYGVRYPNRVVLLNPGPPSGTVQTLPMGSVSIENAVSDQEAGDYLNGSNHTFSTVGISYTPDYNYYRSAPTTLVEYPVTYNQFEETTQLVDAAPFVDGRKISLVLLDGRFTRSQTLEGNLHLVPVSAPAEPVAVTNQTRPLVIRLPTRLSNETWRSVLADEYVTAGGHIVEQSYEPPASGSVGTLVLTFEPGVVYQLRMGAVGVNDVPATPEPPRYAVEVYGNQSSVYEGEEVRVSVEVRDRYNNPVSGAKVTVNASVLDSDSLTDSVTTEGESFDDPETTLTDEQGHAVFTYQAPANRVGSIDHARFSLDVAGVPGPAGRVPFTIEVRNSQFTAGGGGSGGSGSTGPDTTPPAVESLTARADDVDSDPDEVEQVSFDYRFNDSLAVDEVKIRITHVDSRGDTNVTVGERTNLPAAGKETIGLQRGWSNSIEIDGSDALFVNVTAVDVLGNGRTCFGWLDYANQEIADDDFQCDTTWTGAP